MAERRELPMIACTLDATDMSARLVEWRALASRATSIETTDQGTTMHFDASVEPEARRLAGLEMQCCPFFTFAFAESDIGFAMSVGAPAEAVDLVARLLAIDVA